MKDFGGEGPHQGQPVAAAGAALAGARAAVVMVHGRGATAESILTLADVLGVAGVASLAPQAAGNTWYPYSFLAPLAANEPGLGSGLRAIDDLVRRVGEAGVPPERTVILGFSQGACLTLEFAARSPRRYGGVIAFTGGLLGSGERPGSAPPDDKLFDYPGDLAGTPVFMGSSDVDPHVPLARFRRSAEVMRELGGEVTARIYPGMGHTVNDDELAFARELIAGL